MVCLAAAAAFAFLKPKRTAETSALSYGETLFERGDYAAAADSLRAEYRVRPSPQLKRKLAEALLASNDPAAALALLRREDSATLADDEARMLRAESLLRLEQPDEAETEIAPLTDAAPGVAALFGARAAYARGEIGVADTRLAEALRAGGAAAQSAWLLRARHALGRNDFAAADAAAARAAEAGAPKDSTARLRIESLIRAGRFDEARAMLGPERKTPRGEAENAYLRVMLDAAVGDYESAAIRLRTIEPALSREPRGRLIAAYVREGAGDVAQAEKHFLRAAASAPGDAIAQDALIGFLIRHGRSEEAAFASERLAAIAPDAARLRRAEALAAAADYDGAFAALIEGPVDRIDPRAAVFGAAALALPQESAMSARAAYYEAANAALLGAAAAPVSPPDDAGPLAFALAGEIALAADSAPAARGYFAAALRSAPAFSRALAGEARAVLHADGPAAARALVLRAWTKAPDDFNRRLLAARVRKSDGRLKDAVALLAPVRDRALQSLEAEGLLAGLVIELGDTRLIADLADSVRRRNVATPSAIRLLLKAGKPAEAAAAARRILIAAPASADLTALCLDALAAQGDARGESRALILALARRRPDDAALKEAAAQLERGATLASAALAVAKARTDDLVTLRRVYLTDPAAADIAYRFAMDLFARGETRRAAAIYAESCFWGARAACPAKPESAPTKGPAH